jgi:hypothetical protein
LNQLIFIASTGQFVAASLHEASSAAGTVATFTFATPSFISNTDGQLSAQRPQPTHVFSSTTAFIQYLLFIQFQMKNSTKRGAFIKRIAFHCK